MKHKRGGVLFSESSQMRADKSERPRDPAKRQPRVVILRASAVPTFACRPSLTSGGAFNDVFVARDFLLFL